ncbi:transporter, partial [Stenotrophomonas sp. HMWF022]
MRILSPLPALLLAATALSGCSLAPKYERPATPVPPSWPVGDAYLRQSEAALPTVRYSDIFRDARLQQLITQALANNRDLRVAAANIASTRAQYRIQRGSLFPAVSATGRYSYTDRGSGGAGSSAVGGGSTGGGTGNTGGTGTGTGNGTVDGGTGAGVGNGGVDTGGTGGIVTGANGSGSAWSVNLGVNAFELDLFGRIRSLTGAALDRYFATEAAARATRLTLVGD